MRLNQRVLRLLSNTKGIGKIKNYEVVAGGVIIDFNDNTSVIARSIEEIKKILGNLGEGRKWKI